MKCEFPKKPKFTRGDFVALGNTQHDTCLITVHGDGMGGIVYYLTCLYNGCRLHESQSETPELLYEWVKKNHPNFQHYPSSRYKAVVTENE